MTIFYKHNDYLEDKNWEKRTCMHQDPGIYYPHTLRCSKVMKSYTALSICGYIVHAYLRILKTRRSYVIGLFCLKSK